MGQSCAGLGTVGQQAPARSQRLWGGRQASGVALLGRGRQAWREPRQDPKAYKRGVCGTPAPTSLEPQHYRPGLLGHTLPHGYARISPELTATPHPRSQPPGDPRSQRGAVGPGAPKTHEPQGGPSPPRRRNRGNNALRGTDFPSTEKIESNRMATSCICARGVTHTETSHREEPPAKSAGLGAAGAPHAPGPQGRQGPPATRPAGLSPPPAAWPWRGAGVS